MNVSAGPTPNRKYLSSRTIGTKLKVRYAARCVLISAFHNDSPRTVTEQNAGTQLCPISKRRQYLRADDEDAR